MSQRLTFSVRAVNKTDLNSFIVWLKATYPSPTYDLKVLGTPYPGNADTYVLLTGNDIGDQIPVIQSRPEVVEFPYASVSGV